MSKRNGDNADLSALSGLAPELAEMLVSVACDIALVLDDVGVIKSVSLGAIDPVVSNTNDWAGRRWSDTVTGDMRQLAEDFLEDLTSRGVSRKRQLNHSSVTGAEIPYSYTAVRLGQQGPTLAVGRDMRAVMAMQQRLMQAQQDIEQDYWQRRHTETRYRFLFQIATEPALILDESNFSIVDANQAAATHLRKTIAQLSGKPITDFVDTEDHAAMDCILDSARASAGASEAEIGLAAGMGRAAISVMSFHTDSAKVLLLRLRNVGERPTEPTFADAGVEAALLSLARQTADAIVITDMRGRVSFANEAFLALAQSPSALQITGADLSAWITNGEVSIDDILEMARSGGCSGLVKARLLRQHGRLVDVELSATLLPSSDSVGFILRVSHDQGSTATAMPSKDVH